MKSLYPEIEPYGQGMLDVGDGNNICWMLSGNAQGKHVLLLHGGPGSGSSPSTARFFDPARYRIIQFDQRGCGRSLPNATDPLCDLTVNTTAHLLGDIERPRSHLAIEHWYVFGNSWGCTLALPYAEAYPERLFALILAGVTTTRRSEIDWLYRGMAPLLPEEWSQFCRDVPDGAHDGDLVAAYYRRLFSTDDDTCFQAAKAWHDWEAASILIAPGASIPRRWSDPRYRLTRARIITHYFHHHAWLAEGQLLREAHRLSGISGILLQGRLDLEAPLVTAWELSEAWSGAKLVIVPNSAHSPSSAAMASAIVEATDAFLAIL